MGMGLMIEKERVEDRKFRNQQGNPSRSDRTKMVNSVRVKELQSADANELEDYDRRDGNLRFIQLHNNY